MKDEWMDKYCLCVLLTIKNPSYNMYKHQMENQSDKFILLLLLVYVVIAVYWRQNYEANIIT